MLSSDPRPTRWEVRWRMPGAEVRIQLLFWVSCALVGIVYYQYPKVRDDLGGFAAFALWMGVALASLLMNVAGHALAARLLSVQVRIVLSGLGDRLYGLEPLGRWQRVLIALAGPLLNLLLFAAAWSVPFLQLPPDWRVTLAPSLWLLMWVNGFWALLNVLPLWPLDGGRLAVEMGEAVLGRHGQILALLLSLATTLLLTAFVIVWMRLSLIDPFDPRYTIFFIYFCILSLYCYAFWLSAFRALWGNSSAAEDTSESGRAA